MTHFLLAAVRGRSACAGLALALLSVLGGCDTRVTPYEAFARGQFDQSLSATRSVADDANPAALNFVGVHYYLGTGVTRDFVEAGRWFERAARLGNPDAQRNIGMLYLRGLGVRQDDFLAYAWFTEAAERGNRRATAYLALMGDALTPNQMVKARHILDDEIGQRADK